MECQPLKNLKDVFSWKNESDWSSLVIQLKPRSVFCYDGYHFSCHKNQRKLYKVLSSSAPKTIVCHDMKGGYLDDKFVNGVMYKYQYTFYHWWIIDIFVYFSHNFITIPPLMWINAAHLHGVKILGTVITEWNEGEKIWSEIFESDEKLNSFVSKLIDICYHYGFDGYLINIENQISVEDIPKLNLFLSKLKKGLTTSKMLIWYDAVSFVNGKLRWQNELNEHNQVPFSICDGIFLNYNWKNINLTNSLLNAGARHNDVYVGVDVFGRGCVIGGGFDCDKALKMIKSAGLSVALFACGWTHENQSEGANFFSVEGKFWTKLLPYLFVHFPESVPFETTFNLGIGRNKSFLKNYNQEVPDTDLWYNLCFQEYQLTIPCYNISDKNSICLCFDEDYSGGSCILLNTNTSEYGMHKLFLGDFPTSKCNPLKLTIISKWPHNYFPYKLILCVTNEVKNYTVVLEVSKEKEYLEKNLYDYSCSDTIYRNINVSKEVEVLRNDWISNEFLLDFDGKIVEIDVKNKGPTLIGFFSLR